MNATSDFERTPLCCQLTLRVSNSSLVGYLPVRSRKNIASGSGSTPPGAFWDLSQN